MIVAYTGKNIEVNDEMKEYLEKRMLKFKFYYEQILNIAVIVILQRGKITAELKINANHETYFAESEGSTWQESFDSVTDKVETEIKKKKDKLKNHHH